MNEERVGEVVQAILPAVLSFAVLVMGLMILIEMEMPRFFRKKKKLRAK
ncbi:MAG: hypothetical protein U0V04_09735 [Spirosomataceae bacterium]